VTVPQHPGITLLQDAIALGLWRCLSAAESSAILALLGALPTTALIVGRAIALQATSPTLSTVLALGRIRTAGRSVVVSAPALVSSQTRRIWARSNVQKAFDKM